MYVQTQKLLRQKQLEIEDFSVYWDTSCEMLGKRPTAEIQVRKSDARSASDEFCFITMGFTHSSVGMFPRVDLKFCF